MRRRSGHRMEQSLLGDEEMARHVEDDEAEGAEGDEELKENSAEAKRAKLLNEILLLQHRDLNTDIFALLASVLRKRVGKAQQKVDTAWDDIIRRQDIHVFAVSMVGVVCSVAISLVVWYNTETEPPGGGSVYDADGNRIRVAVNLSDASPTRKMALYMLQGALSYTTVVCVAMLVQKYRLVLESKRRQWSGMETYDLVQAASNPEVARTFQTSYSFMRSSLRWRFLAEATIHIIHPFIWFNEGNLKPLYDLCQVWVFLRLYLCTQLVFTLSAEYQSRHQVVASNQELQRTGFTLTQGSTMKMLFYRMPFIMVLVGMLLSMAILGFTEFILEREVQPQISSFGSLQNSVWFSFETFSTIGYGRFAPTSVAGRIGAFLIGATGITLVTIFGGVITNLMAQSKEQRYVSEYLLMVEAGDKCRHAAAALIQAAWRYYKINTGELIVPNAKKGHKSNFVYAAIKRFRKQMWKVSQSRASANDPVIETKMQIINHRLATMTAAVAAQQKNTMSTSRKLESYAHDIIRVLEMQKRTSL